LGTTGVVQKTLCADDVVLNEDEEEYTDKIDDNNVTFLHHQL
jgi:hypothetical protein